MGLDWSYLHPKDVFREMCQIMDSLKNITWDIDKIEIFSDKLSDEEILNFEKNNEPLFGIIKNYELQKKLLSKLSKDKLCNFKTKKPPRISLKPVKSETSEQSNFNLFIVLKVPPELIIFTLFFFRICKSGFKFGLSDTDIKADLIFFIISFLFPTLYFQSGY